MFCNFFILAFMIGILAATGSCVILDILPGTPVPPETTSLTLKCSAANDLGITVLDSIAILRDAVEMASISVGGVAIAGSGFDTPKYTITGQIPGPEHVVSDFLQVVINDLDCNDGVDYSCVLIASDAGGSISPDPQLTQSVTVQTAPSDLSLSVNPNTFIYFENDIVSLTCSGKVGDPAVETWNWERQSAGTSIWEPYPNSEDITIGALNPPMPGECSYTQDTTLNLTLRGTDDNMKIRCLLDMMEKLQIFYVYYGPTETTLTPPSVNPVFERDDMTPVTCSHDVCNPYCEREWYKDIKDFNNMIPTTNGILDLKSLNRSQAGNYICHVENPSIPSSEIIKNLALVVHYGPESLALIPDNVAPVQEGSSVPPITCSVDCIPVCTITWYHRSVKPGNVVPSSNGVLELQSIIRDEAGLYVCEATHSESVSNSQTVEIEIEVNCRQSEVTITSSPAKEEYNVDEEVTMICSGGFDHPITFQKSESDTSDWVDYGDAIDSQPHEDGCLDTQSITVTIKITTLSDGLRFRCIQNNTPSNSKTLKVEQNDRSGGSFINGISGLVLTIIFTAMVF